MRRLINIKGTSEYVSLSPNIIRDLIAKRHFPYVNISRGNKPVFRFDIRELDKWIESLPGKRTEEIE